MYNDQLIYWAGGGGGWMVRGGRGPVKNQFLWFSSESSIPGRGTG